MTDVPAGTDRADIPTIALVGRPNVGKSTLFNRLTRTRDALVADFPGLTRDRQYGTGRVGGWAYVLVDTGGLSGEPETLDAAMASQTQAAVEQSDLVVFLVDGRDGLVEPDREIADRLRRAGKPVLLAVNKVDGIGDERAAIDFHELGFAHVAAVSAAHNRGVRRMIDIGADLLGVPEGERDAVEEPKRRGRAAKKKRTRGRIDAGGGLDAEGDELIAGAPAEEGAEAASPDSVEGFGAGPVEAPAEEPAAHAPPMIGFVGRPNVGKSTLVNRLLGEERVIAYDRPGTTRDTVAVPFERGGREYTLVDTAGVRRRGKVDEKVEIFSIIKTLQAIERANVCVLLLDARDGLTEQDLSLLSFIIDKGRALVVGVNKWDAIGGDAREEIRAELERRVEFLSFTRIHFISALQGSGVDDLFRSIDRAHRSAYMKMPTPRLTRLLEMAVAQHAPPMHAGRRIKLLYAHQGGSNPPIVVVHGRQADKLPGSYVRYLTNFYLKALKLFGTPMRLEFRQGANPYAPRASAGRAGPPKKPGRDRKNGDGRGKDVTGKGRGKVVAARTGKRGR